MAQALIIIAICLIFVACFLLARRDDRFPDLQKRIEILENKTAKKIVSRLLFVEMRS